MDFMKLNIQLFAYYDGDVTIRVKADTQEFEQGLNKMKKSSEQAGTSIKNIVAGLGITKLISKSLSVINSSISDTVKRVDTLNNFPKVMNSLGISSKDAEKSINKMSEKLAGLPTTLDQGANAVKRFTAFNGDVQKSTDMFLAVNNAILAGGASMELQSSALEQLTQAYTKGKPEAQDWKTLMQAMPAQLKQIAETMGYTSTAIGGDFYEALMNGEITMEDFMNTAIQLNEKGGKGFKSFSEQAKTGTEGIGTAITVAKTQVVKGMADIVSGINKGLKKAKLGSISDIIASIGKKVKEVLSNIGTALSKIDFKGLLNILSKLVPIIGSVVAGFVAYNVALKAISAINLVKNITSAISAFVGLTSATELSAGAMKIFNTIASAHPIGLVVAAVGALTTAFVAFGLSTNDVDKEIERSNKVLKEYDDTMKKISKRKDEALSASMNEIYGYQSLYDELQTLVDENGKVKDGYEDRVKLITGELSKALGIEIGLTDGVVQNYKELQKQIDILLEKKKAEAYFNAHQEEYQEAIKKEATLQKEVTKQIKNRDEALEKIDKNLKSAISNDKELGKYKSELLKYYKGEIEYTDLSAQAHRKVDNMRAEERVALNSAREAYIEYNEQLEKSQKKYAQNEIVINNNRKAQELLALADQALAEGKKETADEYLNQVARVYNDTVTFNGKLEKENNDAYEKEKTNRQAYLDFLKQHQDIYSEDFIKSEEERIKKELEQLEKEKNDANDVIKKKNQEILDTTRTGINDQLKALTDKQYEFRDAGNGNVQLYVDGVAKGEPMAIDKASKITSDVISQLNSKKIDAETAGNLLSMGFGKGIEKGTSYGVNAAISMAAQAINAAKNELDIHSPSRVTREIGKYFSQGFSLGVEDEERNAVKTVKNFSSEMLEGLDDVYLQMQRSVDLETSKMSANVKTSGTYQIAMNSTPTFNLRDNSTNRTELVVNGRVLAEVVNTENRNREVARA